MVSTAVALGCSGCRSAFFTVAVWVAGVLSSLAALYFLWRSHAQVQWQNTAIHKYYNVKIKFKIKIT
jgi:hypothetical protein